MTKRCWLADSQYSPGYHKREFDIYAEYTGTIWEKSFSKNQARTMKVNLRRLKVNTARNINLLG